MGTYTYEPEKIKENGKDRMRFELGDTMVQGREATCALADDEIEAALETYPKHWKHAKLMLLESIYRRFSYEVDTKTGPLSLSLSERAKLWKEAYEKLKAEVALESCSVPVPKGGPRTRPYFYPGMQQNKRKY